MHTNLNNEWLQFMQHSHTAQADDNIDKPVSAAADITDDVTIASSNLDTAPPPAGELFISTKSKMANLTEPIPLVGFWSIPVISYDSMELGIIKKQIKYSSNTREELFAVQERLAEETGYTEETVIKHLDTIGRQNRPRFKDIRKISIGINQKSVIAQKKRTRQLVNNSFTLIARVKGSNNIEFCEIHVKVFNTGKLEMPGVQNDIVFERVLHMVVTLLQTHVSSTIECVEEPATILINSTFFCGYYIDRSILYEILIKKYNIKTTYDQCTYPGIKCRYYYNRDDFTHDNAPMLLATKQKNRHKDKIAVTFVIFRTGSVLIMGMCTENVLYYIYDFLKTLFQTEYHAIQVSTPIGLKPIKKKNIVAKKRIAYFDIECDDSAPGLEIIDI